MTVSVGAHVLLMTALLLLVRAQPFPPGAEQIQAIAVQLLAPPTPLPSAAPTLATTVPKAPAEPAAPPTPVPPASAPEDGLKAAQTLYAGSVLAEPGSRRLVKTLASFADSERIVQLCNIESTEQIRRADRRYDPDVVVSYALADTRLDGNTLVADGAAFHSGRGWYGLRFRCTVAADYSGVTAYRFAIGAPVPRAEWDSHNLPEQYQDSE